MSRRALLATLLTGAASRAVAQGPAWPSRPITIVVPYAPGGTTDIAARVLAEALPALLGQPCIVENRPGGATQIATDAVARAVPDGHTLLLTAAPLAINPALFPDRNLDPGRSLRPVTLVVQNALVLLVPAGSPARDVAGLLALGRARGGLNLASAGNGSMGHMTLELFAQRSGAQVQHVPYRGSGAALPDLIAGTVDGMWDNPSSALPLVREGRLRALAVSGTERNPALAEVPTVAASLPGFSTLNWFGLLAPAGVPESVVQRLHAAVTEVLRRPAVAARFAADGVEVAPGTPEAFAAFLTREVAQWGALVRARGIRPE